ncbi:hypothetical protein [Paenibacillus kobensis]|uniref:hypothetical protein n=1 Tax=Paenibacillus kobensis TaxID=59841 RepID=UPI000FDC7473|nr:hypothetical protein [Paenibacillus kobensis]
MLQKSVIFILVCLILVSCSQTHTEYKYSKGKDTVKMFGDGTFELQRGYNFDEKRKIITLYNHQEQDILKKNVAENILSYKVEGEFAYFLDDTGRYLLLDIKRNEIKVSNDLSAYTQEQQQIFNSLHQ